MSVSSTTSPRAMSSSMHRLTGYSWANATILMGVFTALWGTVATMYLPSPWTYLVFGVIALVAVVLVVGGIRLLGRVKELREPTPAESEVATLRRRTIGLALAAEVFLLAVGFPLLAVNGLGDFMVPYGALIVGLHFLPFAWAFQRRFDYLIGGWTVAWATIGFAMILLDSENVPLAWSLVGLAACVATISYGVQMLSAVVAGTAESSRFTA